MNSSNPVCSLCREDITAEKPGFGHFVNGGGNQRQHRLHYPCMNELAQFQLSLHQRIRCPECREDLREFGSLNIIPDPLPDSDEQIQSIARKVFRGLLVDAAWHGHVLVVRDFLQNEAINEESRSVAFDVAASNGRLETAKEIWGSGPISDNSLGTVVREAGEADRLDVIQFLLENAGGQIHLVVGKLLYTTIINNKIAIVRMVLQAHPDASPQLAGNYILQAVQTNKDDIAKLLIQTWKVMDDYSFHISISLAAQSGRSEIVEALLANTPLSEAQRARLIRLAQEKGHANVEAVLKRKPDEKTEQGKAASSV